MVRILGSIIIFDFISNEYLDRNFKSSSSVEIPSLNKPVSSLRIAKRNAIKSYWKNEESWKEITHVDSDSWENKVAFETSISLERIGISVFSGALPVRLLLLLAADQILEDYIVCHYWIRTYRERERTRSGNKFDFHRRYSEWIVMLSALWMEKYYPDYKPLSVVNRMFDGKQSLIERFVNFTHYEYKNLSVITKNEILNLLEIKNFKQLV